MKITAVSFRGEFLGLKCRAGGEEAQLEQVGLDCNALRRFLDDVRQAQPDGDSLEITLYQTGEMMDSPFTLVVDGKKDKVIWQMEKQIGDYFREQQISYEHQGEYDAEALKQACKKNRIRFCLSSNFHNAQPETSPA